MSWPAHAVGLRPPLVTEADTAPAAAAVVAVAAAVAYGCIEVGTKDAAIAGEADTEAADSRAGGGSWRRGAVAAAAEADGDGRRCGIPPASATEGAWGRRVRCAVGQARPA